MAGHIGLFMVIVDSYHGIEIYVFVHNLTKGLYYRGILIVALENGLERK